jgi:hypothetical protein
MGVDMKDNMKWIKNMGMEFINGPTEEYMKEAGLMGNSTDRVNICCKMELSKLENGKQVKELTG